MAHSDEISISRRPAAVERRKGLISCLRTKIETAWHFLAPSALREIRLLNARCGKLIPSRLARYRFVSYAASRRLFGNVGPLVLHTPLLEGPIFVRPFSSDVAVAVEVLEFGDYDFVRSLLISPKTILDLGANIGLSVRLWQSWFSDAEIVALEPSPATAGVARLNIRHSDRPETIKLLEAAINPIPGTVYLNTDDQPWADHLVDHPTKSTVAVQAMTVSECLEIFSRPIIDLVKCDIEGAEAELFADCRSWISAVKALVVETHAPYNLGALMSDLARNDSRLILRGKIEQGAFCLAFFSQNELGIR